MKTSRLSSWIFRSALNDFDITVDSYGLVYAPGAEPRYTYRRRDDEPFEPMEIDDTPTWEPGDMYPVEKILKAEKRGGVWYVLVKWEGWLQPTEERRKDLLKDCSQEVRKMVADECARAQMGKRAVTIEDVDEFDDELSSESEDETPASASEDDENGQYMMTNVPEKSDGPNFHDVRSVMCIFDAYSTMLDFAY